MKESRVQDEIRLALGLEDDLVLWRNNVGVAQFDNGSRVAYGLAPGSADLVGILAPSGRWFCLELKRLKGGRVEAEQKLWHALVRRMGGFCAVVRSVDEARAALERARTGATE